MDFDLSQQKIISKIKVLFYFMLISMAAICQNNSLVIFSASGNPFYVTFNGESINVAAQSNVKIFDINAGWSTLCIKVPGTNRELILKDSILLSSKSKFVNKEFTYVLIEKGEKLELQFNSVSELSGPKTPPVPEEPKVAAPLVDNSIYGNLYKAVNNKPVFYANYDKETSTCKNSITDKEVRYAINLMTKANDKEAAYRYLTQIVDLNCYSTLQLKDLLETAPIDMDRLHSAKKAYTHVTDPQNIGMLLSIFKYPTMKESYASFLKDQENIAKQKTLQCKEPLNDQKFNELFSKVKSAPYENEKLIVSKKIMAEVCLSSTQIKKISELYTHDREKLEYMKYAFNVLTDKENGRSLADEFQYQGTKDEFLKYITP
ncbi:MAG: DUF4476 domain-containing protein [Bacteroidota bacterium]